MNDEIEKLMNVKGIWLKGNWRGGWALDYHTISSTKLPEGGFETKRPFVGEFLYWLKYHYHDLSNQHPKLATELVQTLAKIAALFLQTRRIFRYLDAIIPVPPSQERDFQPVEAIATEIGKIVNLPVVTDYIERIKQTPPLKSVDDPIKRKEALRGAFRVKDQRFAGKVLLVFDDIYRSGETLSEITRVLYEEGKVKAVYVLTLTRTRVKR